MNAGSPGAFNCTLSGTVTSSGYNYSDDDTCDLLAGTDQQTQVDPILGALASNGGPTQTRLPLTGSPLINAIPVATCGGGDALAGEAVTTDQRGVTRPQDVGCRDRLGGSSGRRCGRSVHRIAALRSARAACSSSLRDDAVAHARFRLQSGVVHHQPAGVVRRV